MIINTILEGRAGVPPPAIGLEGPEGIPIDMSWPGDRLAVDLPGMTDADRDELVAAGWRFIDPDPDIIEAALVGAAAHRPRSDA